MLERQIQETQEECTRAEAEPDRIRAAIEEAREQRGEAIARNLDLGSITRTIKKLKDDLELSEDTVKGLGLKLARLYQEREAAEAGLREALIALITRDSRRCAGDGGDQSQSERGCGEVQPLSWRIGSGGG